MTLHAAKGLEFPVVFVIGVEHGILPHQRSTKEPDGIEEERRLLFVGMTRAREELYLSHVSKREFRGQTKSAVPSEFLAQLPQRPVTAPARPRTAPSRELIRTAAEVAGSAAPAPLDPNQFRAGMLVRHPLFGLGRITDLSGYGEHSKATVKFTLGGTRKLSLKEAKLQPIKSG
jgi:DNA helicase-2/ATP-dependent DNA helicase PcrA